MNPPFFKWEDFQNWLEGLGMFHMNLELDRIQLALKICKLENPAFPIVQVVGTNGKGSTSSFLSALSCASGLKTGLFTSPHFLSPRERILVNGKELSEEKWLKAINELQTILNDKIKLTYFEFVTLLAVKLFTEEKVDMAIFEAGLGGRYDATSELPSAICCFTPIALDHTAILGKDLVKIASDKAGALHGQKIAVTASQTEEVLETLTEKAESLEIPLLKAEKLPPHLADSLSLAGEWQKGNAALALEAWLQIAKILNVKTDEVIDQKGLSAAFIPGRMQIIGADSRHPKIMLDGAHNPHALSALGKQLETDPPACIIFSALKDKDWKTGLAHLVKRLPNVPVLIPQLFNSRAENSENIATWLEKKLQGKAISINEPCALSKSLEMACQFIKNPDQYILICGSLFLLADFYKLFPQYLRRS